MNTQKLIAGVDEAGRGPLVGNVVAAAVILDPNSMIPELDDSKKYLKKTNISFNRNQDKSFMLEYWTSFPG